MDILTIKEMYGADRTAVSAGVKSLDLMEAAGTALAEAIKARWEPREVMVLAGPGNNGGDGFVAARRLKAAKWPVTVYLMGEKAALKGDAAANARRWRSKVRTLDDAVERLANKESDHSAADSLLVIDALFGAGLSKALSGAPKILAEMLNLDRDTGEAPPVVAADIPSGLAGDTGFPLKGVAMRADLTVTFCRPKPAHLLEPGRELCGELLVADIGIPDHVVDGIGPKLWLNTPDVWERDFPRPGPFGNKYARGHVVVLGGAVMTGAARLAAFAARRMGAGLATIACPEEGFEMYVASTEPGTLISPYKGLKGFRKIISDERKTTCVLGPGAGVNKATRDKVLAALKAHKRCVLDADALSAFKDDAKPLFKALKGHGEDAVLTPHAGEFARVFPNLAKRQLAVGKLETTRAAAKRAGAVVLYKGVDTVVAAPDGRATIANNAPPILATAGSGDVLAGFIGALLAEGMPAFEAASAAVWLHGECASSFGPGLVAEDLSDELPGVLDWLYDLLS